MGTGPIAWACLLLTVHQGPSEVWHLNYRDFRIPIVLVNKQTDIQQFILFFSKDEGESWQIWREVPPSEKAFIFNAEKDGKYWFIVGQKDQQGNIIPKDPMRVRPNQRIVVDTVPPKVQIVKAERQTNGEVLVRWTVADEYPDPQSLRLDYHTPAMPPDKWTPLPVDPQSASNEKRFNPGNAGEVRVRVQIRDWAKNAGQDEAVVTPAGGATPAPTLSAIPTSRVEPSSPPGLLMSRQSPPPPSDPPPPSPPKHEDTYQPVLSPAPMSPPGQTPTGPVPVATGSALSTNPPATFAPQAARGALPELRIVNTHEVRIEFEVAKVGPSGLGGADVYVTLNEGATWDRWPGEVPITLPTSTDMHGTMPVRGSVTVQLTREGVTYGFIVAVKSRAGLARPAPKPGEPPHVRVELDTTVPKAEMYEPRPDPSQSDTLILSWNAVDRNMPAQGHPIALEWAERREGPWNTIGGDHLPNAMPAGMPATDKVTGACSWHLLERMPSRVYLRLTVEDKAGNRAVAETATPVLIDLSVPETNVIGVTPGTR